MRISIRRLEESGGLLITGAYYLAVAYADQLPIINGGHQAWRYTLISGMIPALPLLVIRLFIVAGLPELSKVPATAREQRVSGMQLFQELGHLAVAFYRPAGSSPHQAKKSPAALPNSGADSLPLAVLRCDSGSETPQLRRILGGRVIGTSAAVLTAQGANIMPGLTPSIKLACAAGATAF
jgi:hypothetical protein